MNLILNAMKGVMYIGAARCIAMVLVWTAIAGGDQFLCVSLVLLLGFAQLSPFLHLPGSVEAWQRSIATTGCHHSYSEGSKFRSSGPNMGVLGHPKT